MSKAKEKAKKNARAAFWRKSGIGQSLCPRCKGPGSHFVPPSFGEEGFYGCDEREWDEPE